MASRRSSDVAHPALLDPLGVGQVEVEQHDDAGLGVQAGQGDDADPDGDAQVVVQQVKDANGADQRERHGEHDDGGLDDRAGVQVDDQQDDQQGERARRSSAAAWARSMYSYWPLQKML